MANDTGASALNAIAISVSLYKLNDLKDYIEAVRFAFGSLNAEVSNESSV